MTAGPHTRYATWCGGWNDGSVTTASLRYRRRHGWGIVADEPEVVVEDEVVALTDSEVAGQAVTNAVLLLSTAALTLEDPDMAEAVVFAEESPFMDMDPLLAWGAIIAVVTVAEAGGLTANNLQVAAAALSGTGEDEFDIPPQMQACPKCSGAGHINPTPEGADECPLCFGDGQVTVDAAVNHYLEMAK
jgi:hypothetical protein